MDKHTPTPWNLEKKLPGCVHIKGGQYTVAIIETYSPDVEHQEDSANAAHIVKCVNAHGELLATLKEAKEFVAFAATKLKYQSVGNEFYPNRESAEGTLSRVEQAIAKAEGVKP